MALFAAIFPMILGFVLGNTSQIIRDFLAPGEKLVIPVRRLRPRADIDFRVLFTSGAVGISCSASRRSSSPVASPRRR